MLATSVLKIILPILALFQDVGAMSNHSHQHNNLHNNPMLHVFSDITTCGHTYACYVSAVGGTVRFHCNTYAWHLFSHQVWSAAVQKYPSGHCILDVLVIWCGNTSKGNQMTWKPQVRCIDTWTFICNLHHTNRACLLQITPSNARAKTFDEDCSHVTCLISCDHGG